MVAVAVAVVVVVVAVGVVVVVMMRRRRIMMMVMTTTTTIKSNNFARVLYISLVKSAPVDEVFKLLAIHALRVHRPRHIHR